MNLTDLMCANIELGHTLKTLGCAGTSLTSLMDPFDWSEADRLTQAV
jgi:hypothetical protein